MRLWRKIRIRIGDAGYDMIILNNPPDFRDFGDDPFCGFFPELISEEDERVAGQVWRLMQDKAGINKRCSDLFQRLRAGEIPFLNTNPIHHRIHIVNEPLPAGAGIGRDIIWRRNLLVKMPAPAPGTGREDRLHRIDQIKGIGDAVITTNRALHTPHLEREKIKDRHLPD
jgi:hypothetical protein